MVHHDPLRSSVIFIALQIIGQILRIGGQVALCQLTDILIRIKDDLFLGKEETFHVQKLEKSMQIHGIGQTGKGSCGHCDSAQKISAGLGQFPAEFTDLQRTLCVNFFPIFVHYRRHAGSASFPDLKSPSSLYRKTALLSRLAYVNPCKKRTW